MVNKLLEPIFYGEALDMGPERFVEERLIPAILREAGRGFAMEYWVFKRAFFSSDTFTADGVAREFPSCGTVACLGGTAEMLIRNMPLAICSHAAIGRLLGLSLADADTLFYGWQLPSPRGDDEPLWPTSFRRRYHVAKTPLGKARVAVAMLREAVRTRGECFRKAGKKR